VFFPVVNPEKKENISESFSYSELQGEETILVVEDQAEVRDLIHHTLKQFGYTIILARDGLEALEICRKTNQKIDLILTDVIMPHMNGPRLAQEVLRLHPEIKVIFMSGYTDKTIPREQLARLGATYLQKPFSHNQLAEKIRKVLNQK
jgi:CheY-like chemotaxis protein